MKGQEMIDHRRGAEGLELANQLFGGRHPKLDPLPLPPPPPPAPGPLAAVPTSPSLRTELLVKVIDSECFPNRRRAYATTGVRVVLAWSYCVVLCPKALSAWLFGICHCGEHLSQRQLPRILVTQG